jgi:hypothetical protein
MLNHKLQVVVGLVELIPEEKVGLYGLNQLTLEPSLRVTPEACLGQLEFLELQALHDAVSNDIRGRK